MGLSHITVIVATILGGLLSSGCSKTPPSPQRTQTIVKNAAARPSTIKNLGVIQLTNRFETQIDLGKGTSCTITPQMSDHHTLLLTLAFGSKNAEGVPTGLCVTQVTAKSNQPFDITVNDMDLAFTPRLVE
jgi:hypothetical protein